ncbi:MAG: sigma-70 family RNA polymerase sigma factor [Pyrinomonadaceae bacterium]
MKDKAEHTEKLIEDGARRLLARATQSRSLEVSALSGRLRLTLEKYLLKHDPNASTTAVSEFLDTIRADDVCLIVACERGDENAWNELVEGYGATVRSAARSASSNEDAAEDLAQSIWAELHGLKVRADGRAAGKLAYYSGVGSLGGWLRAVVGQLAIDQHRKQARLVQTEEEPEMDRLAHESHQTDQLFPGGPATLNPEDSFANKVAGADVEKALARAIAELEAEDRLLVKLYYFDGLRLREAGTVLGVHEATASRRLTRVHGDLRQRVGAILMTENGWTKSETDRSLAEVTSHLEVDLEPLVSAPALDANSSGAR